MKNRKFILVISSILAITACGGNNKSSSKLPTSSSVGGNSSSTMPVTFEPGLGGLPGIDDGIRHNSEGWTFDMFAERMEDAYYNKNKLKKFSYARDVYLRGSDSKTNSIGRHEILNTNYEFKTHDTLGEVLTGRCEMKSGNGILKTEVLENSGYAYDIQSYASGGYLHYLEAVDAKDKNNVSRVSYDSISKNNRYNNMYTIYSANPDLVLIESAYRLLNEWYDTTEIEVARYIDTSSNEVICKVAVEEHVEYPSLDIDSMYYTFMYAHADKETKKLTRIDYGWVIYDIDGRMDKANDVQTIRVESVYNYDYSPREKFNDKILTENDVEKIYGGPAQHYVDYSGWSDGILDEAQAKEILANLQCFGTNTVSTKATFNIDNFIDPNRSVDDDGEFNILGSLRGQYETKKYDNDFVETNGHATLSTESGALIEEFDTKVQAEANDDGMYVIEDYSTSKLFSHKHTWEASEIDDVDPYIGVNPIFRDEIFHPFKIAGNIGTKNPGVGDDDEEIPTNFYSTDGYVVKNGNSISGTFTKIYHKNIWTPYWTYTVSFDIKDGFLSLINMTVTSYYETDFSQYTIRSSFSFSNTKGTTSGAFNGEKLNPDNYEESELMAKNERLYK